MRHANGLLHSLTPIFRGLCLVSAAHAATTVISTPPTGGRLLLCGSAGRQAGRADRERSLRATLNFKTALPVSCFTEPYWESKPKDAYVCLDTVRYRDSDWNLPGFVRDGAFSSFEIRFSASRPTQPATASTPTATVWPTTMIGLT